MDTFKPAYYHLVFVGTSALPVIFQMQNIPSEIFRLFCPHCSMSDNMHDVQCTVHILVLNTK